MFSANICHWYICSRQAANTSHVSKLSVIWTNGRDHETIGQFSEIQSHLGK